jgi:serine/threonine protein kinase
MNDRTSLRTLQSQYAYKQDVDVRKGEKLTGGFGKTIYKAEWINGKGSPIVLLEMEGSKASEEILLYISLSHPHIIKTYGLVKPNTQIINTKSVLLLQEYARDGDLGRMLSDRYFIPSQSVLLEIFIQISDAMSYLTGVNIIHGDLACRNVLVFKSDPQDPKRNLVKLIDFGLTRDESIPLDEKISIPVRYAATEILRSNGRSGYSEKSDVFSFAVLMWEAYSPEKRMPYELISDDKEVCQRKLNGEKLPRPDKCDAEIWALMLKCWNDRPEDRPTFQMIHTQLKNIQKLNASSTTL